MEDFRVEMEKLVILDYLMRNTDRGLDNFMVRVCNASSCPDRRHRNVSHPTPPTGTFCPPSSSPPNPQHTRGDYWVRPHCHVAAIDNSLAFPHHHPNGWRNYAYGWLFLPASLIGQPFSRSTREHFLPLLTSPTWWAETVHELRKLFGTDPDFNVRMFERQMAVMKGQAWNIVESLKHEEEGPLELCRRQKALVWDEPVQLICDEPPERPVDIENGDSAYDFDDRATGEELRSTSAPAYPSYLPTSPMTVTPPRKRPAVVSRWSFLSSGGHKIPPRPIGLASHHLRLDGARGLDVMKQLDALEAWHTESETEVSSYRSPQQQQSAHLHRSPHSKLNHSHRPPTRQLGRSKRRESEDSDGQKTKKNRKKIDEVLGSFASRRSKSDSHILPLTMTTTTKTITTSGAGAGASVNEGRVVDGHARTDDQHQPPTQQVIVAAAGEEDRKTQDSRPVRLAAPVATVPNSSSGSSAGIHRAAAAAVERGRRKEGTSQTTPPGSKAQVIKDHEQEDEDGDGDDEDENDEAEEDEDVDHSIQIAIIEKLEFVIAQPVFKNC